MRSGFGPDRPPSGFQRLKDFGHAIHPLDLRALLDPQPEDQGRRNEVRSGLTSRQLKALGTIESIDQQTPLNDRDLMRWKTLPDLAFACGLDRTAPRERFGAMLARAYARADRYAEACAEEASVRQDLEALHKGLAAALKALAGQGPLWRKGRSGTEFGESSTIGRALAAYERMTWWPAEVTKGRQADLVAGIEVLEQVEHSLAHMKIDGPAYGWPLADGARFFFLLRLAEIFAVSTGLVPSFSGYRPKGPAGAWTDYARAGLDLTGLGTANFDELSRHLGGKQSDRIKVPFEHGYGHMLTSLAEWLACTDPREQTRLQEKCAGELPSAGRAIDVKDGGEPAKWGDHRS